MGVRGLTTFIKTQEKKYLKSFKLHNSTVLLDGNSVATNLYISSNLESAFGGDYDKFSKYVKEFFKILKKCEIHPLVVFDGGYEQRKLRTVYSRMKDKCKLLRCTHSFSGSFNFPLFMRTVFREVLTELNIPFVQSDFEADDELAALARQLQCPVISYDSDFYIYDVSYIPFPSIFVEPLLLTYSDLDGNIKTCYYLECKIYSVDVFIESFGGLNRNMLPLLPVLLGNDYIKRSVFKAFYSNLKIPRGKTNHLQRRIKAVIDWLRNETFDTAVTKILGRMKTKSRKRILYKMEKIINGYVLNTSVLSEYLITFDNAISIGGNVSDTHHKISSAIQNIEENLQNIDDKNDQQDFDVDSPGSSDESIISMSDEDDLVSTRSILEIKRCCESDEKNLFLDSSACIPKCLLESARRGKIQSCIIDILTLKQYFLPPQVEDHDLPSSHFISLPILNALVGILLGECDTLVKYWTRTGFHLDWFTVEPIYSTTSLKFPPYDEIVCLSESLRRNVLLEVVDVDLELSSVPNEWQLFVIAAIFWLKNMKDPVVKESHMHTVVMCLVAIYTIDSKIGVHRNKQTFTRKYKNFLKKLTETRNQENLINKSGLCDVKQENIKNEVKTPEREFTGVSHDDCVLMFETILPYHHLNEQIKNKPKLFCVSTLHGFSQLQSCIFHLMLLNSVLGFPFKEPIISHLYSGTFIYNMFTNLSSRNNISVYLETLFRRAPSLFSLYTSLIDFLKTCISSDKLLKNTAKPNRKKKRKSKSISVEHSPNNAEDVELFVDENNRFSKLSLDV